jgi:hypothetical protein
MKEIFLIFLSIAILITIPSAIIKEMKKLQEQKENAN